MSHTALKKSRTIFPYGCCSTVPASTVSRDLRTRHLAHCQHAEPPAWVDAVLDAAISSISLSRICAADRPISLSIPASIIQAEPLGDHRTAGAHRADVFAGPSVHREINK